MAIKKYTRRDLLGRMGGSAAAATLLPFLPYTELQAQQSDRKRYCYWFTPVMPTMGNVVNACLPSKSGGDVKDLVFPQNGGYNALNEMAHKIAYYRGMTNKAANNPLSGGHASSSATMLVGSPAKGGGGGGTSTILEGKNGGITLAGASSIDQWMSEEFKRQGKIFPISDLRYGYETDKSPGKANLYTNSFLNGREKLRERNPQNTFDAIFGITGNKMGGGQGPAINAETHILDYVKDELKHLERQLSLIDKERLQNHIQAIDDYVLTQQATSSGTGDCDLPGAGQFAVERMDHVINAFTKLNAIAFNCDLTRIAGAMWGPYQGGTGFHAIPDEPMSNINNNSTWHGASHGSGGNGSAFCAAVMKYRAKIFVNLLKEFDSFKEPDGSTLLDNSIVHWYVEVMPPHSKNDLLNMIGGGAGHFKTGKQLVVPGATNKLLVSILNAMGFDRQDYGAHKEGPIPSKYLA